MLENDLALVTGASRGIGHAIALALGGAGARVIGTSTSAEGAAALTERFRAKGIQGRGAVLDASKPESIDALLAELEGAEGLPTILVNNAAVTRDKLLLRMKPEDWDVVLATNLTSVFRLSKACLKRMMKERRGRIVNITSIVGVTGNPGPGELLGRQGGRAWLHQVAGARGGFARHHRERGGPGIHRHGHDPRAERGAAHRAAGPDSAGPAGRGRRHRGGGAVPGLPAGQLHHGRDAACQRRHVHALTG